MFSTRRISVLAGLGVAMFVAQAAVAQPVASLTDRNSTAKVNVDNGVGQFSWVVDGIEHLSRQWFWYRLGPSGTTGPATPFDSVIRTDYKVTDGDFDAGDETLVVEYTVPGQFKMTLTFALLGGVVGSNVSDIAEGFVIDNLSGGALDLQFFQYADLDLGGDAGDDKVTISGGNTAKQNDDVFFASEAIVGNAPSHFETDIIDGSDDTLDKLAGGFTDFDDAPSAGIGNVSWAFQWDFNIPQDGSVSFSKNKNIQIPAPGAALLAVLGMSLVGVVKRRRSA